MNNEMEQKRQILQTFVNEQRVTKLIERRGYYDSLAKDDQIDEPFNVWNEDMSVIEMYNNQVSLEDITKLEAATQRKFPERLKNFWQEVGKFSGQTAENEVFMNVYSVNDLLPCFSDNTPPYQKLTDLGLITMMNWVWGNAQTCLTPAPNEHVDNEDGTYTEHEKLADINKKLTCFGSISDGYCEGHIYLHYEQQDEQLDQPGKFGMTYWDQGNSIPLKPDFSGFDSPEDLLLEAIKAYKTVVAKDEDDEPFVDMSLISDCLIKNNTA